MDQMSQLPILFLASVGLATILWLCAKYLGALWRSIFPFFVARPRNLHRLAGAKWALVTGASDGIGKQYAAQLAQKGFNLVLVSRSAPKLEAVRAEINAKFAHIQIKLIAFNFTNPSAEAYKREIFAQIEQLQIGILVNNVGVLADLSRLEDTLGGYQTIAENLTVNTLPHTLLCAFALKQMRARRSGVIINISSISSYHPYAHMAAYCSVKKYLTWLSECLRKEEAKGSGITIQTVCPGFVHTKMVADIDIIGRPSLFAPCPETFVRQALRTVGHAQETTGYFAHQLQAEHHIGWIADAVWRRKFVGHKMETPEMKTQKTNKILFAAMP